MSAKHVFCKEHHLTIGINDLTGLRHDAEAVAVAVEGKSHFRVGRAHERLQVLQVGGLRRIGVMIREMSVDLRKERQHPAAESVIETFGEGARHAVAAVDGDRHRTRKRNVAEHLLEVGRNGVHRLARSRRLGLEPLALFNSFADLLDLVGKERNARHHHLETVVLGGIVRTRDGHARSRSVIICCEIKDGSRRHADVDHVDARREDALDKRIGQTFARESSVSPDAERLDVGLTGHGTEHSAYGANDFGRQRHVDNPTDVVRFENGCIQHVQSPGIWK